MKDYRLQRYPYDPTGTDINNLVIGEKHTLASSRRRVIVPMHAPVYTNALTVTDLTNGRTLTLGVDYRFAEIDAAVSVATGKDTASVILVENPEVSSSVSITYQSVGMLNGRSRALLELLSRSADTEISLDYIDINNKPDGFTPSPHLHAIKDLRGLDDLLYHIERIRLALYWVQSDNIEQLARYVQDELDALTAMMVRRISNEYIAKALEYVKNFNKSHLGVPLLANYATATKEQAQLVYNEHYSRPSIRKDAYIATEALVAIKELLYTDAIAKGTTPLGDTAAKVISPTTSAIAQIQLGTSVMVPSMQSVKDASIAFDAQAYPSTEYPKYNWVMTSVAIKPRAVNAATGAIIVAVQANSLNMYTGHVKITSQSSIYIEWSRTMNATDAAGYLDSLVAHIANNNNPHKTRKSQVQLSDVENLPVATREDVICGKAARKYLTYEGLLLLAKKILTGMQDPEEIKEDPASPSVYEKYQMQFAPCGPCGTLKEVERIVEVKKDCEEKGKLLFTFCKPGFTKSAAYADGNCGFYVEDLETNSEYCGYKDANANPQYQPRDKLKGYRCDGFNQIGIYHDGQGSTYEKLIETNSAQCGYRQYEARGTLKSTECDGTTKVGIYHDGYGGEYKQDIEVNSAECGYVKPKPKEPDPNAKLKIGFKSDSVMNYKKIVLQSQLGFGYTAHKYEEANTPGRAPLLIGYNDFPMSLFNPTEPIYPPIYALYDPPFTSINNSESLVTEMKFGATDGKWDDNIIIEIVAGETEPKAGKYLPDSVTDGLDYTYTKEQAAIMQKLLVARTKAIRLSETEGKIVIKNPPLSAVKIHLEHSARNADTPAHIRSLLEGTGVLELTKQELALFPTRELNTTHEWLKNMDAIMLAYPTANIKAVVYNSNKSTTYGWLRVFQVGRCFKDIPNLPPLPSGMAAQPHEKTPLPLTGYGKWYEDASADAADYAPADGNGPFYARDTFKTYMQDLPYYKEV